MYWSGTENLNDSLGFAHRIVMSIKSSDGSPDEDFVCLSDPSKVCRLFLDGIY